MLSSKFETDLDKDAYAVYLPAVNDSYANDVLKDMTEGRPFPDGLTLRDLIFWEPNGLWHYPYLLHSIGLYSIGGPLKTNAVLQRNRANNTLLMDSGGFQIGKGTMKGLSELKPHAMKAADAEYAWRHEPTVRSWIVGNLDTYADYGMTIDMPLWAKSADGQSSPFHNCSTQQLIEMTVDNLRYIESRNLGRTKWLNVVQGGDDPVDNVPWWDAVKWFRHGGWAMAGSAGAKGGLHDMLAIMLRMRDEGAFEIGQDWVHVLGVSTPKWAVLLTAIQKALREVNPALRVSYDSSSPFQTGGKFEEVCLSPAYTSTVSSWGIGTTQCPQGIAHADATNPQPFPHGQSPLGQRLMLHHLNVKAGIWDKRSFDFVSNLLLVNHNVWVYLDAMKRANDAVAARDATQVPTAILQCVDFIADVFRDINWQEALKKERSLLDSVAPNGYQRAVA